MAISQRPTYFYDSNRHLTKQGSMTYDSDTDKYMFVETEANINQGDIGTIRLSVVVRDGLFSGGYPHITYRRPDGYLSPLLQMSDNDLVIIELDNYNYKETVADETALASVTGMETNDYVIVLVDSGHSDNQTYYYYNGSTWVYLSGDTYQVFYVDFAYVGWTYLGGLVTFLVGYLSNGTYINLDPDQYLVNDGINSYEEITGDEYNAIYNAVYSVFSDLGTRVTTAEENIDTLETDASDLETRVSTAEDDIVALETVTAENEDDLRFPATTFVRGANSKPDFDYTNICFLFPKNNTDEAIYLIVQMPHDRKADSDIEPHVHCRLTKVGNPMFEMKYKWYNINSDVPVDFSTYVMTLKTKEWTSGTVSSMIYGSPISGVGKTASSILIIKLYRTDNSYDGDLLVDEFDIHYVRDKFGETF